MHGPGAQLPVRAVQPPGGVRGVRRGDHGGVSAVPDVQHGDRPGGESDGRGGGVSALFGTHCQTMPRWEGSLMGVVVA